MLLKKWQGGSWGINLIRRTRHTVRNIIEIFSHRNVYVFFFFNEFGDNRFI